MTFVWFIVWLLANSWGDNEALTFDPVNIWAGTLLLAVALDLGRQHASFGESGARAARTKEAAR